MVIFAESCMVDVLGLDWRGFLGLYLNVWNCNFAFLGIFLLLGF